jgi:hypothetical protein
MNVFESHAFQHGVLWLLLKDQLFCESYSHVVKIGYFRFNDSKGVAYVAMRFFKKYFQTMSKEQFEIEARTIENTKITDKLEVTSKDLINLYEKVMTIEKPDREWFKDQLVPFAKQREAVAFLNRFKSQIENDEMVNLNQFDKLVDEYNKLDQDQSNLPQEFMSSIESLKEFADKKPIPTPWQSINRYCGGVGEGELWGFLGRTNVGKSAFLTAIGVVALKHMYNVFHWSFEDSDRVVKTRYASALTGIIRNDVPVNIDAVISNLRAKGKKLGKLFTQYSENFSIRASDVRGAILELERREKINIDLIIIDYAPLFKSENGERPNWETYEESLRILRGTISSLQKRGFSGFQGDKSSESAETSTFANIGKAYGMAAVLDGCISINQTFEERDEKAMRLYIVKLKDGEGVGKTIRICEDHSTCTYDERDGHQAVDGVVVSENDIGEINDSVDQGVLVDMGDVEDEEESEE